MSDDIDFKAIYKDLGKQEARVNLFKKILLWCVTIIIFVLIIASIMGYIHLLIGQGRCNFDKELGDICIP